MNAKKILTTLLAAAVCSVAFIATASAEVLDTDVAKIGDEGYETLKEAVEAADDETVELLRDASGDGIVVAEGQKVTIDLGGYTYTIDGALVGSKGTETLGIQLLKGAVVTIMDGAIEADVAAIEANQTNIDNGNKTLKMLIQNYADLTLEDVVLDMSGVDKCKYVLSNNCGDTVIGGETDIIAADGNIAMDICAYANYPRVSVEIADTMTGTIEGDVVYDAAGKENKAAFINSSDEDIAVSVIGAAGGAAVPAVAKLGDAYYATLTEAVDGLDAGDEIEIVGTVEDTDLENAKAALGDLDLDLEKNSDGSYSVAEKIADTITVIFDEVTDPDETEFKLYDIILTSETYNINRLNSADFTFAYNLDDGTVKYEIIDSNNEIKIYPVADENDRYEFHYKNKDNTTTDTATKITIGQVKFTGFGTFDFSIVTGEVHATTEINNIVDSFAPGAVLDGKAVKELVIDDDAAILEDVVIKVPTQKLTINVTFPNNVITDNDSDYMDMTVTISGGELAEDIVISLGGNEIAGVENGTATVTVKKDSAYVIELKDELTLNRTYNVKIEGAGYRTAYADIKLTEDKVVNFWNNVKDAGEEIVRDSKVETQTSFLAGDIVANGVIDKYDLSAVVSYFGEEDMNKYDLNRDGVIDSKDVAYVLVSWDK